MVLNPNKCVFGVTSDKLLGFIVSREGIEVDHTKFKAILEMPPPRNLQQSHNLQGNLQAIYPFID